PSPRAPAPPGVPVWWSMPRGAPTSALFPYTTLSRSHHGALACKRLAQQPAAAADVKHACVAQRGPTGNVGQSDRIHRVERLLRPLRVPPPLRQRTELVELGLAEVLVGERCCAHADSPASGCGTGGSGAD